MCTGFTVCHNEIIKLGCTHKVPWPLGNAVYSWSLWFPQITWFGEGRQEQCSFDERCSTHLLKVAEQSSVTSCTRNIVKQEINLQTVPPHCTQLSKRSLQYSTFKKPSLAQAVIIILRSKSAEKGTECGHISNWELRLIIEEGGKPLHIWHHTRLQFPQGITIRHVIRKRDTLLLALALNTVICFCSLCLQWAGTINLSFPDSYGSYVGSRLRSWTVKA